MDGNNMNTDNMVNQTAEYTYVADDTYEVPAENQGSNALAIVALICGILSLVCCMCFGAGVVPGIVAIICGAKGKKKCPKATMAKVGMILGIVGVVIGAIAGIILMVIYGGSLISYMSSSSYYY